MPTNSRGSPEEPRLFSLPATDARWSSGNVGPGLWISGNSKIGLGGSGAWGGRGHVGGQGQIIQVPAVLFATYAILENKLLNLSMP